MKSSRSLLSVAVLLGLFVLLAFAASPASAQTPDPLVVKKDGFGTYVTTWKWTIEKSADQTEVHLAPGATADVNYTVTASAEAETNWTVGGPNSTITVRNVSGADINVEKIVDTLSDGTVATIVRCRYFPGSGSDEISLPYTLPPTTDANNGFPKIVCEYEASGTGTPPANNTAVAYIDETTVGGQQTYPVTYSDLGVSDECIDVSDTFAEFGGPIEVCAGDAPKTFTYTKTFGPYTAEQCDQTFEFPNTASFVTKDTGKTGSSNWNVTVKTDPCDEDKCYADETAWAAGSRYVSRGNWATYTSYAGVEKTVTLFAGQTYEAGTVHFSAVDGDGNVTITITLNPGFQFDPDTNESVKIQDYAVAPTGNPSPGGFAHKGDAETSPFVIVVPQNNFYGVHVDVEREVACPV